MVKKEKEKENNYNYNRRRRRNGLRCVCGRLIQKKKLKKRRELQ